MPCYHPLRAWRTRNGVVSLGKEPPDSMSLRLPCGGCIGCRTSKARAWAFRCHLELHQHPSATFTTLTYADAPPTLIKRDLSLWLKRFRRVLGPARPIRFFACGEYGENNGRAHYHAIIFGANVRDRDTIETTWGLGRTHTVAANAATIAYVAGYVSKKLGMPPRRQDVVDYETGELLYTWQPPFILMSRRPGIGGHARSFTQSWRMYAVHEGSKLPVPRFFHEAWKKTASPLDLEELASEKSSLSRIVTSEQLAAGEKIALSRQQISGCKRKL